MVELFLLLLEPEAVTKRRAARWCDPQRRDEQRTASRGRTCTLREMRSAQAATRSRRPRPTCDRDREVRMRPTPCQLPLSRATATSLACSRHARNTDAAFCRSDSTRSYSTFLRPSQTMSRSFRIRIRDIAIDRSGTDHDRGSFSMYVRIRFTSPGLPISIAAIATDLHTRNRDRRARAGRGSF